MLLVGVFVDVECCYDGCCCVWFYTNRPCDVLLVVVCGVVVAVVVVVVSYFCFVGGGCFCSRCLGRALISQRAILDEPAGVESVLVRISMWV